MAGRKQSNTVDRSSSLDDLQEMLGQSSSLDMMHIDASLLWMAVVMCCSKGASLSFSLTKSQKGMIITIWDGKFPAKFYPEGEEQVNRTLAGIAKAYGKGRMPVEWLPLVDEALGM